MTDAEFRSAALAHARRHPEDVEGAPHGTVQRVEGGAFVELSCWVPDEEKVVDISDRIALG